MNESRPGIYESNDSIWLWQTIVSPHMAGLAVSLAQQGIKVTYVAEQGITADRVQLGWQVPEMPGVQLYFAGNRKANLALVLEAPKHSIHISQGLRGNGMVAYAQQMIAKCKLRHWIVMETVDDKGVVGITKRWLYRQLLYKKAISLEGILAIGQTTDNWIAARGFPGDRIYPFAYFLSDVDPSLPMKQREPGPFRFLFVGQFIKLKRLHLLIHSLYDLLNREFELIVVGSGAQERRLRMLAESVLPGRLRWMGRCLQPEVSAIMQQADCLVLPSRYDGWGGVISEAMMVGTPVICSDSCGAAGVVRASGCGGIFHHDQSDMLRSKLEEQLDSGPIDTEGRNRLSIWAKALGANEGAKYLLSILDYAINGGVRPMPPWST